VLLILLSFVIFLLLLPSLVHLPLLSCTFIILNIQYFWIQHYIFAYCDFDFDDDFLIMWIMLMIAMCFYCCFVL